MSTPSRFHAHRHVRWTWRVLPSALVLAARCVAVAAADETVPLPSPGDVPRTEPKAVEEVLVTGTQQTQAPLSVKREKLQSVNTLDREDLQRHQGVDVFSAVQDLPGVTVEGGPRTSGKSFSIRGFSSNEDVMVQIDGVTQNFEKYRYGSGVDIEPELIKSITVQRGGASVLQGSGYIGGAVNMETRSAGDLLGEDRRWGATGKLGYMSNNEGKLYALTGYARPVAAVDALFSVSKRDTRDYALPDGSRFENSAEDQLSALGKVQTTWRDLHLTVTQRHAEHSGLEPFDITGGVTGVGGTVLRDADEDATALRAQWTPDSDLLAIDATLGFINKGVVDRNSAIAGVDAQGNPIGTDTFDYQIWTSNLINTSSLSWGELRSELKTGVQANRERRQALRENLGGLSLNPAQPSGEKQSHALLVYEVLAWRGVMLEGGVRHDWYRVSPGHDTKALLAARGEAARIEFDRSSPAWGASYEYGPATVFYRWNKTFRAPLLDEYYARGSFSSCFEFSAFTRAPTQPESPTLPTAPVVPDAAAFPDIFAFLAALDRYNTVELPAYLAEVERRLAAFNAALAAYRQALTAYRDDPAADINAMCAGFYQSETAVTREAGFALAFDGVLAWDDRLAAKLTYFDVRVSNLLESIFENARTHEISQPGREVRTGFELELHYDHPRWFADFALGTLDGYFQYNFFADNIDPTVAAFGNPGTTPLFNQPGNTLTFTVGGRPLATVEVGHRLRAVSPRDVTVGVIPNCPGGLFTNPVCNIIGQQAGYITSNWFAAWQPGRRLDVRLTVDNALDRKFQLAGFGGALGAVAPGRDVRLSVSVSY